MGKGYRLWDCSTGNVPGRRVARPFRFRKHLAEMKRCQIRVFFTVRNQAAGSRLDSRMAVKTIKKARAARSAYAAEASERLAE